MIQFDNQTAWDAGLYPGWSRKGERQQTLVVKIGFRFNERGQLTPTPLSIVESDEYRGKPETGSLIAVTEITPFKQGGELYLYGSAQPQANTAESVQVEVGLRYDNNQYWSKELRVFGQRHWERKLFTLLPSHPHPLTEPVELIYEHAYGGHDPQHKDEFYLANPAGCGYSMRGLRSKGLELPQLELPPNFITSPASRVRPAGYAPLPAHWAPRSAVNVNIDQQGVTSGNCPFQGEQPAELYNCAPVDQRFATPFCGPLTLKLSGLVPEAAHELLIDIAPQQPFASVALNSNKQNVALHCDTLVINSDDQSLALIYRGAVISDPDHPDPNGWVTLNDANSIGDADHSKKNTQLEQVS